MRGEKELSIIFTDYNNMASMNIDSAQDKSRQEVISYLNASPENAVVIPLDEFNYVAVFRGAGGDLNNFYYQESPLSDPNDANGGDLTAEQAFDNACTYF